MNSSVVAKSTQKLISNLTEKGMIILQIYVDADACPVKKEIEQVATRHKINVILVSNGGLGHR